MLLLLKLAMLLGAAAIGGLFFAFSTSVMKALAGLPANHAIHAMQRINAVILNPLFLGVFMGTAVVSVASILVFFSPWRVPGAGWLLVAGVLYLVGTFGITIVCNVPRNERLARLDSESPEAAEYWRRYLREWTVWNHVRGVLAMASAACGALSLVP